MLNLELGLQKDAGGRTYLITTRGHAGHAVYGPYEALQPGNYAVEFTLALAEGETFRRDFRCAILDVVCDAGNKTLARKQVYASQLRDGRTSFDLRFSLGVGSEVEYRIWVSGDASLAIDGYRRLLRLADDADADALLARGRFPDAEGAGVPFFQQNVVTFRALYERDIGVRILNGAAVLTVNGVSLYARSMDDLAFIGEVFHENVYNFMLANDVCAIDIGMNIGLSSLMFASKPEVREVHSFEPFPNTFDRALDNLSLNPDLAAQIRAHNFGMSDRDSEGSVFVATSNNSGAMSTVRVASGVPVHLSLKHAATFLRPIIMAARARGRDVVVKVDCEGSEFAIFEALLAGGLLPEITAFMVEWHAMFAGKTQEDLIRPLREAGFIVFDRSPPSGNGFFYAVRIGRPPS